MIGMANHLLGIEKGWLLSQIGLIPDCDDDVMDEVRLNCSWNHACLISLQSKWSSCSWLLLREFVKIRQEQEREFQDGVLSGSVDKDALEDLPLPVIPYVCRGPKAFFAPTNPCQWRCRQIMTRPDFLEGRQLATCFTFR
jgi:hypothetical protein